jgi:hypothetical protein
MARRASAGAGGHALDFLAETKVRRGHRSHRRLRSSGRPRCGTRRHQGLRRDRRLVRIEVRDTGKKPKKDLIQGPTSKNIVLLGEVRTARSAALTQSKDPYSTGNSYFCNLRKLTPRSGVAQLACPKRVFMRRRNFRAETYRRRMKGDIQYETNDSRDRIAARHGSGNDVRRWLARPARHAPR